MISSATISVAPALEPLRSRRKSPFSDKVNERLHHICLLTGDPGLRVLAERRDSGKYLLDELNNRLMAIFRDHALVEAYSLLYDLNFKRFLLIIFKKIKCYCRILDPNDVLQDVFLSIYRYPYRFREEKKLAFRNWTYSIIRNTILIHLKKRNYLEGTSEGDLDFLEDRSEKSPLKRLLDKERQCSLNTQYIFLLLQYLKIFNTCLSEREKRALELVEVEGLRYREAAQALGINFGNFKMVVCRARKKLHKHAQFDSCIGRTPDRISAVRLSQA